MNADMRLLSSTDPREALAAACRLAYVRGLVSACAGNASVRLPDGFLCTCTGCCLGEVAAGDLVHCDGAWRPVDGQRPSSEWRLHARIYEAAPAIGAVLHTHSPAATALAVAGRGVGAITPEAAHFLGQVPCIPFALPGTDELGRLTAAAVRSGAHAALLERHGAVTWGESPRNAFFQAELLESVAALVWRNVALVGDEP